MEETKSFDVSSIQEELVLSTLKEVKNILEERGYEASNQIVGYLMSGDPGYITSYKNARGLILSIDRSKIIEILLKDLFQCDT